ncbi:MAG: dihydropteroate synthase, partial [Betaproteobacteria bacterium]
MPAILRLGRFTLDLSRAQVMGVLNVTPDSFADGGRFLSEADAIGRVQEMLSDGADIIDIGGESTRPGAAPTTEDEELGRVIPLLRAVRSACDDKAVPISVD